MRRSVRRSVRRSAALSCLPAVTAVVPPTQEPKALPATGACDPVIPRGRRVVSGGCMRLRFASKRAEHARGAGACGGRRNGSHDRFPLSTAVAPHHRRNAPAGPRCVLSIARWSCAEQTHSN